MGTRLKGSREEGLELLRVAVEGPGTYGQRLRIIQAVRDAGMAIPSDAFGFIDLMIDEITAELCKGDPESKRLGDKIRAFEYEHNEGESYLLEEAPTDYLQLQAAWDGRRAQLYAGALRAFGEGEMAQLLEQDPEEYDRQADRTESWKRTAA